MKKEKQNDEGGWAFAIINGRLAEFFFDIKKGKLHITYGHCYVKREEYKTKKEQRWIDKDIKHYHFTYRKGKYRRIFPKL